MASGASLKFSIIGDNDSAIRAMRQVEGEANRSSQKIGSSFKKLAGIGAGLVAAAGIGNLVRDAFNEASEAQKVAAQSEAVLKSTGGAANVTAQQMGELAGAISAKAAIDDEAIQSAENMLATFTNVRNEVGAGNDIFNQATQTITDMSVALGQDMSSSAVQLGKALNDPIKGITALSRVGVAFTEQQKEQIKTLVESGDVLAAQKIILGELSKEFGGSAEAQATSADRAKVALGNLEEEIGQALMPAIEGLANFLTDDVIPAVSGLVHFVQDNSTEIKILAAAVVGGYVAFKTWKILTSVSTWLSTASARYSQYVAQLSYGTKVQRAQSAVLQAGALRALGYAAAVAAIGYAISRVATYDLVFKKVQESVDAARQATGQWRDELLDANLALTDNIKLEIAKQLQDSGVAEEASKAGISLDQLVAAVVGGKAAVDNLTKTWDENGDASAGNLITLVQMGDAYSNASSQALKLANSHIGEAAAAKDSADATDELGESLNNTKDKAASLDDAVKALTDSWDRYNGRAISATRANIAFEEGLDNLTKSFKGHNDTLDISTAKGRDHVNAILDEVEAAKEDAQATFERTKSSEKARAAFQADRAELRQHLVALGLDKDAVKDLLAEYAKTPKFKTTTFELRTAEAEAAIAHLNGLIDSLGVHASGAINLNTGALAGPGHAAGTSSAPAGWAWVGERGPELMRFRGGETVLSHPQSMRVARGYANGTADVKLAARGPQRIVLDIPGAGAFTGYIQDVADSVVQSHGEHRATLQRMRRG